MDVRFEVRKIGAIQEEAVGLSPHDRWHGAELDVKPQGFTLQGPFLTNAWRTQKLT